MKKIIILLALISTTLSAQDYAQWSLEMAAGTNKVFSSIDQSKNDINLNMSGRYMFNETFGLMGTLHYDKYRSNHQECEYLFSSYKATMEGVLTLARMGDFTLLGHGGFGGSYYNYQGNMRERVLNSTAGTTLLYRLGTWGAAKATLRTTAIHNLDKSFDIVTPVTNRLTNAQSFSASAGFVIYLDNNRNKPLHYDFYRKPTRVVETRYEIQKLPIINYVENCDNCKEDDLKESFYFKRGKHGITTEHRPKLQKLANYLIANKGSRLEGTSWACVAGTIKEQKKWSVDRANEVTNTLVALGVKESQVNIKPMGADTNMVGKVHDFAQRVEVKIVE